MNLAPAPPAYSKAHENERTRALLEADRQNHKRGLDLEISPGRVIMTSPNGAQWVLSVDNAGALTAVPL